MRSTSLFLLAVAILGTSSLAYGDVTINHVERGAFNVTDTATGDWKVASNSYQVRAVNGGGTPVELTRNYTNFDLSGLSGTITGATLEYYAPSNAWNSSAASETVGFYDVSTSPAELVLGNAGTNPGSVFPDLGSGTSYGSIDFTAADVSTYVTSAPLNADALLSLNAAVGNGTWAVGGALTTIDGSFVGAWERVLKGTGTSSLPTRLVLTGSVVPEPSTVALLVLGCCGMTTCTRRRRS